LDLLAVKNWLHFKYEHQAVGGFMSDGNPEASSALSYKGSLSGLRGLLTNNIAKGIANVVSTIEQVGEVLGENPPSSEGSTRLIPIEKIAPCPTQPRQVFDAQSLEQLSMTMKEMGQAQAITVRLSGDKYEIISGERRYRAAKLAGLTHLHCLIKDVDNKDARLLSLVENLQRDDLLPIEEAHFLKRVLSEHPDLNLDRLARMLGSHKSTLSEKIQLTEVPEEIQKRLYDKDSHFTHRHWRVISRLKDRALAHEFCLKTIQEKLSVAELERSLSSLGVKKAARSPRAGSEQLSFETLRLFESRGSQFKIRSLSCDLSHVLPDVKVKIIEELEKALAFVKADQSAPPLEKASLNASNLAPANALGRIQQAAAQAASAFQEGEESAVAPEVSEAPEGASTEDNA
jgi:ParB family chromosome partitioning protein